MRAGYYSIMLSKHPLVEAARRTKAAGYEDLAINCDGIPLRAKSHLTPETTLDACRAAADIVRGEGLGIPAISANYNIFGQGMDAVQTGIDYITAMMDRAAAMDVPYVHIYSGDPAPGMSPEQMFKPFVETMRELLEAADRREIRLGLECPAPNLYPQVSWHERLLDALPPESLYINYDPSHFEAVGDDPADVATRLSSRIEHVHIKDAKGLLPDFTFPPPW